MRKGEKPCAENVIISAVTKPAGGAACPENTDVNILGDCPYCGENITDWESEDDYTEYNGEYIHKDCISEKAAELLTKLSVKNLVEMIIENLNSDNDLLELIDDLI